MSKRRRDSRHHNHRPVRNERSGPIAPENHLLEQSQGGQSPKKRNIGHHRGSKVKTALVAMAWALGTIGVSACAGFVVRSGSPSSDQLLGLAEKLERLCMRAVEASAVLTYTATFVIHHFSHVSATLRGARLGIKAIAEPALLSGTEAVVSSGSDAGSSTTDNRSPDALSDRSAQAHRGLRVVKSLR